MSIVITGLGILFLKLSPKCFTAVITSGLIQCLLLTLLEDVTSACVVSVLRVHGKFYAHQIT